MSNAIELKENELDMVNGAAFTENNPKVERYYESSIVHFIDR